MRALAVFNQRYPERASDSQGFCRRNALVYFASHTLILISSTISIQPQSHILGSVARNPSPT
jgi:hypothetical protein